MSGGVPTCFPRPLPSLKWRKAPLEKHLLSQKKLTSRFHSHGIERNKYQGVITKRLNFNCPHRCIQWMLWANWERLGAKCSHSRIFEIFQPERMNFKCSFGDRELLPSSVFPQRWPRKPKQKTLSLLWKISLTSGGIKEHKTYREG